MSKANSSIGNTSLNRLTLAILGSLAFGSSYAADLPAGGAVKFGSGTISQPTNQQMQINQSSDKLAIEWQSFNVAEGSKVNFQQPNSNAIALNRVVGTEGSKVMGQLNANGRVFLVNPNGVLFGSNAQVNVGGLVASTQDLTPTNFSLGKYNFSGGNSPASVVNQGTITAKDGGAVVLLGGQVSNQGNIQANLGSVKLAAGKATTLDFGGDGLVNIQVTGAAANALAENSGFIQADGGQVVMSAAYANSNVLQTVVNNTGTIQAQTLSNKSGKIVLSGGQQGLVNVDGILDASTADQGNGGNIETSGQSVNVSASASVDTRGFGGQTGTWTVAADKLNVNDSTSSNKVSARAVTNSLRTSNVELISNSGDLTLGNDVSWSTANQLLLAAQDNIVLNANLKATGKNAGVAFIEGGDYVLAKGKSVTLSGQGASFSNNGQSYTVIQNVNQLQAMENDLAGYYVLGNTIDASSTAQGAGFRPIGGGGVYEENPFSGIFSGLGQTINQLTIKEGRGYYSSQFGSLYRYSGLFGTSTGELRNVGLVGANVSAGGLVSGIIEGTTFIDDYDALGRQRPYDYVGGLVAKQTGGSIHDVYAENVNVNNSVTNAYRITATGGLIGHADVTVINNVYATGTVKSDQQDVGGLIGSLYGNPFTGQISYLSNSYAAVNVNGTHNVGGLMGIGGGAISNSYATGNVVGTGTSVGGLIGSSSGMLSNLYASGDVSGGGYHIGGLIGALGAGYDSPTLLIDSYASGKVSGQYLVGGLVGGATSAVDYGGSTLTISKSYATGNVSASSSSVGGLVGSLWSSEINDSYATGSVTGSMTVGGLVGTVAQSTISNSHATGNVIATIVANGYQSQAGGLVGFMQRSAIKDSYAAGNVTGGQYVGGLVGSVVQSTINNSTARGNVAGSTSGVGVLFGGVDYKPETIISNSYGYGTVNGSKCTGWYCGL
ncbi:MULTISPECIES: GLUG motif-containing protein [unclassified Serratia (in: enterobacteria)]|uniref:two-partner secretion domain-containing protein n=1 Tax=unclassified Serratia (in: enterobacteria) TaxID=2647522 RepID=UPI00068AD658|nr:MULTISPECIES: GLUG motif-containing protein [unclassified Serratia (in: enterobacteria)]